MNSLADRLAAAHAGGPRVPAAGLHDLTPREAYALQDATIARLGPIGGWKVGARSDDAEPQCAPLPQSALLPTGSTLPLARFAWRLVELEVALRVAADLRIGPRDLPTPAELAASFDAVLPAIEAVEGRWEEGQDASATAKLADLQCHGALVLGPVAALAPDAVDLRSVQAELWLDGDCVQRTTGGNPAPELWRLIGWLARHCSERGLPLRRGQIVTTGSCTGLTPVAAGAQVRGELAGIGSVSLRYGDAA